MDHSRLSAMKETNPQSTDIFEDNVRDTFYPQIPRHMEDVCLYDFVAEYTKCAVDKDGKVNYVSQSYPIIRYTILIWRTNVRVTTTLYSFSLYHFVNLIEDGENAESAFNRHMQNNDAMNTHSEKLQRMLKSVFRK